MCLPASRAVLFIGLPAARTVTFLGFEFDVCWCLLLFYLCVACSYGNNPRFCCSVCFDMVVLFFFSCCSYSSISWFCISCLLPSHKYTHGGWARVFDWTRVATQPLDHLTTGQSQVTIGIDCQVTRLCTANPYHFCCAQIATQPPDHLSIGQSQVTIRISCQVTSICTAARQECLIGQGIPHVCFTTTWPLETHCQSICCTTWKTQAHASYQIAHE